MGFVHINGYYVNTNSIMWFTESTHREEGFGSSYVTETKVQTERLTLTYRGSARALLKEIKESDKANT